MEIDIPRGITDKREVDDAASEVVNEFQEGVIASGAVNHTVVYLEC